MMDECNHQLNVVSTYPFFTIPRWNAKRPADKDCPYKGDTVVAVLIDRRLVLDAAGRVMRARDFTVGTEYPMVVVKTGVTLNKAKLVYLDKSTISEDDVAVLKGLGIVAI